MKITLILALFVTFIGGLSFPQSLWAQSALGEPTAGLVSKRRGGDFRLGV